MKHLIKLVYKEWMEVKITEDNLQYEGQVLRGLCYFVGEILVCSQKIKESGLAGIPLQRVVGADTFTPLAGAAFLVIPSEDQIVAAAARLRRSAFSRRSQPRG